MIFPGTEVRLTGQWFPGSSFLPFLKMGTTDCHDSSSVMESSLATPSANSLRILGCISSGPID